MTQVVKLIFVWGRASNRLYVQVCAGLASHKHRNKGRARSSKVTQCVKKPPQRARLQVVAEVCLSACI